MPSPRTMRRGGGGQAGPYRISRGALYLLLMEVGLSCVYIFAGDSAQATLASWLVATPDTVWRQGKVWTLLTSAFLQPSFISLVFHGLILWMFVPTLERWWGTRRFLTFALATSAAGTLGGTLAGLLLGQHGAIAGLDPFIYASIVAFGIVFASHPVQFFGVLPMNGRQLTYGILAFVFLFVVLQRTWALGAGFATAIALSWALTSGAVTPRLWWLRWRHGRVKRHLRVVRDDDEDSDGKRKHWLN